MPCRQSAATNRFWATRTQPSQGAHVVQCRRVAGVGQVGATKSADPLLNSPTIAHCRSDRAAGRRHQPAPVAGRAARHPTHNNALTWPRRHVSRPGPRRSRRPKCIGASWTPGPVSLLATRGPARRVPRRGGRAVTGDTRRHRPGASSARDRRTDRVSCGSLRSTPVSSPGGPRSPRAAGRSGRSAPAVHS